MRNIVQLVGGVAVAGAVAAGATAFTAGGGVALGGANGATTTKFIGGAASQTVSGATVTDIAYTWVADGTNTKLSSLLLTFADATAGKTPTVTLNGLVASSGGATFTCAAIHATAFTSNCTPSAGTFDGQLTRLDISVV
ncbi:hypothetical protein [Actinoplanes sp. NPDC049802]|uniref:hypothetical protein n=1 Tax=Actinoplanes sp. NPDC049802 TaxID=3154742 RepID=UPI0033CF5E21